MKLQQILIEGYWTEVPFDKSPTGRDTISLNVDKVLKHIKKQIGGDLQPRGGDGPVISNIPGDASRTIVNMLSAARFSVALSTRSKVANENRAQVKLKSDVTSDAFLYVPATGNLYYSPVDRFANI